MFELLSIRQHLTQASLLLNVTLLFAIALALGVHAGAWVGVIIFGLVTVLNLVQAVVVYYRQRRARIDVHD